MIRLSELIDNDMIPKPPEQIKTLDDELDNYNKKAKPSVKDEEEPNIDLKTIETEIGENTMGIKLSTLMESEQQKLTPRQKREVLEAVKNFNEFASKIYRTDEIKEMVESIKLMASSAGQLALQETDGWFDSVTVKNDVKGIGGSVDQLTKTANEMNTLQQRLESVFEDIGHKLGKYYEISEALDSVGKEDGDIDNDGDEDESDKYLAKKRAAIANAIDDEEDGSVNESVGGFRGIATGRNNFGKVRYDGWKRTHIKEAAPSAEKGLKTIPAVLSWDIEQFLKKQKDAKKLTKGSFTDLVKALHSRGFADRLNGANLRNFQAVAKKHIKEAAPKMKTSKETKEINNIMKMVSNAKKAGGSGRYGKEFDSAKKKALKAINDMLTYSRIGA